MPFQPRYEQGCCAYFSFGGSADTEAEARAAYGRAWEGAMTRRLSWGRRSATTTAPARSVRAGSRTRWAVDARWRAVKEGIDPTDHEPSRAGRCVIGGRPGAPILFIVNPASAAGRAGKEWAAIDAWLATTGLPYEATMTTRPLEAIGIAQIAVRQSRPVVVAVGGDGTLNEVVNGFFNNGAPIPTTTKLAMLPLGTGGDFRRTLRIPLDFKEAVQIITSGTPRRLDAGCATYAAPDGSTAVRHFINIADLGLSSDVANRVNTGSKRFGAAAFTITSALALLGWKNKPVTVVVDGNQFDLSPSRW